MSVEGSPGVNCGQRGHHEARSVYEPRSNYWGHSMERNRRKIRGEGMGRVGQAPP